MKTEQLKQIIREEVKKIVTNKKSLKEGLDPDTMEQIDDLMSNTIEPAFYDDMALTPQGSKLAADYLIKLLTEFKAKL
jgi:hypothetical protein